MNQLISNVENQAHVFCCCNELLSQVSSENPLLDLIMKSIAQLFSFLRDLLQEKQDSSKVIGYWDDKCHKNAD